MSARVELRRVIILDPGRIVSSGKQRAAGSRAHRPAFDFAGAHAMSGNGRTRTLVARAKVCREDDAREVRGSLG